MSENNAQQEFEQSMENFVMLELDENANWTIVHEVNELQTLLERLSEHLRLEQQRIAIRNQLLNNELEQLRVREEQNYSFLRRAEPFVDFILQVLCFYLAVSWIYNYSYPIFHRIL